MGYPLTVAGQMNTLLYELVEGRRNDLRVQARAIEPDVCPAQIIHKNEKHVRRRRVRPAGGRACEECRKQHCFLDFGCARRQ